MTDHLLSWLVLVPLGGAVALLFFARQAYNAIRAFSLGTMGVTFLLSLWLLDADYGGGGFRFVVDVPWVPAVGIAYRVGVDGLSLWLVLLTTLMSPLALWVSWLGIDTKVKEYAVAFLILEAAMVGAFVSLDLFFFYVFWELMLVPMYFVIGVWGGGGRVAASVKFFLYTMLGSLLMLVAMLYVVAAYQSLTGAYSFDVRELGRVVLPYETQLWLFVAFALAFAIKVPLLPFHTWQPDAYTEAPTGGTVVLAAVMAKLGTYGFLRFAMPLFPLASHYAGPNVALLAVVGIVWGAWCAWVQRDVKRLVAYSSISHVGFIVLGLFAMNGTGVAGSVLQMVNHGISTGALFILVGVLYQRSRTRDLEDFGGLARAMPLYTTLFVVVALSSIGLPATNGFVGEFMVLAATFASGALSPYAQWFALAAATGVILAAVYMLHAVLRVCWGPARRVVNERLPDMKLGFWDAMTFAPIGVLAVWLTPLRDVMLEALRRAIARETIADAATGLLWVVGLVALHWGALRFLLKARETAPAGGDARRIESVAMVPLVVLIFWIGVFPTTFLDRLQPAADRFVAEFQEKLQLQNADDSRRLLDRPAEPSPVARSAPRGDTTFVQAAPR